MATRNNYMAFAGYDRIRAVNDLAAWFNLLSAGNAAYVATPLSYFRLHAEQRQQAPDVPELGRQGWQQLTEGAVRLGLSGPDEETIATMVLPLDAVHRPSGYERWITQRTLQAGDAQIMSDRVARLWKRRPLFEFFLILCPGHEALLADTIDSLPQQYYDGWRLSIFAQTPSPEAEFTREESAVRWLQIPNQGAPGHVDAINARLLQSRADWVGFFECGTQFEPNFLLSCCDYIATHPEWRLIYCDEDAIDSNGRRSAALFKPDINLEFLRATDYVGDILVDRNALIASGGFSSVAGAERYDTVLRLIDAHGEAGIGHLPDVLHHVPGAAFLRASESGAVQALEAHLARKGIDAEILQGMREGETRRLHYRHASQPKVSIVIPTRNQLELLEKCVESLIGQTSYPDWELLLIDNGSDAPEVHAYYAKLGSSLPERVRILPFNGPFNFSAMNNLAAREARGDYLLLLNNDTECIHDDWLEAMMSHAQRLDVGIVGARLLFPDSLKVQHAGVILGMTGTAGYVFLNALTHDEPGYLNRAVCDQEYSAVTGACLLIRKSVYNELGGLDEQSFTVSFNDVDLCLKARQKGYRVVWTPFATLLHHGSASQNATTAGPEKIAAFQNECNVFFSRWKPQLANDPEWNRNLSLVTTVPTIEDELAVPWNTDFHDRPRIVVMPMPSAGAAEYRSLGALRALHATGRVQYASVCQPRADFERAPMPVELARMAPDTLVMHAPVDNVRGQALLRYKEFNSDIFRVYSLDDLITNIPEDNPQYQALPAPVIKERLALGLAASHRLVVSTQPLADACRNLIDDIRIVPNALDWNIWGGFHPRRQRGKKLRVGWAGAQQHAGDLRFIQEVIKATCDDVDWVFFGMMPEGAASHVAEFHEYQRDFSRYPEKLASLDLDLAIAPLHVHPFNEAKSNLRLLEYGMLGWPVICTDIFPYQTDNPPVTRLPNQADRWIAAIRERIGEWGALASEGDAMHEWVKQHYLLENRLDAWFDAFTR